MQSPLPNRWWIATTRQSPPQANSHNITASDDRTLARGKRWKQRQGGQQRSTIQRVQKDLFLRLRCLICAHCGCEERQGLPGAHKHTTLKECTKKKKEEKSTSTLHNVALLIFCPHKVFLFFRQGGMTTWKGKCNKEDIKGCEYTQYKMQDLNCFNHSWNKWEPVAPHFQWPESLSRREGCHVSYTDRRKDFAQINFALWDRFFIRRAYRLHKFQWV